MKPNISSFGLPENGSVGYFFSANNFLCRRKREGIFKYTYNVKMPTFTQKRQAAAGECSKWRENHGHVVTFAFRVSRKHDDAKSLKLYFL